MYRFWEIVTRPLLDTLDARSVIEIGSDHGYGTQRLLAWAQERSAIVHVVDPLPKYDVDEWRARWGEVYVPHVGLSLNALPRIGGVDAVLIDGDHNWYTVYHELKAIEASVEDDGFPLVILHDVGWPYGRRDLYYDPETIPDWARHPHRRAGIGLGSRELLERGGLNPHLENATDEGTPRNGVLTAVEDFLEETGHDLELTLVPAMSGLGVLVSPDHCTDPEVKKILAAMEFSGPALDTLLMVERERNRSEIRVAERTRLISKLETRLEDREKTVVSLLAELQGMREQFARLRKNEARALVTQRERIRTLEALIRERDEATQMLQDELRRQEQVQEGAGKAFEQREQLERQLVGARTTLDHVQLELERQRYAHRRLARRRSVRAALAAARLARPLFSVVRRLRGRRKPPPGQSRH